jgi:serine/threonine-protein kinase
MPTKVILKVTKGQKMGEQYSFDQRESLVLGRQNDCNNYEIVFPEITVSRYHCLIEITPPTVMVRDFGSLNGTFLNGEKIGQRDASMSADEGREQKYAEFPLNAGDRLGLGKDCEITLEIAIPQYCAECFCEIDQPEYTNVDHQPVCPDCHAKTEERRKREEEARIAEEKAAQEREEAERQRKEAEARERAATEEAEKIKAAKERQEAEKREAEAEERRKKKEEIRKHEEAIQRAEKIRIAAEKEKRNKCKICGTGLSANEPDICFSCRQNPLNVLQVMLLQAKKGDENVKEIEGYRNIKLLGKGGMGAVWLVEEEKTGKEMALKLMIQGAAADEKSKQIFMREALLSAQLKHENVVRQYKCGEFNDAYFILMELCRGGSVDDLIKKKGGRLDIDLATYIILQVLEGLHYTHNTHVVATLKGGKTAETKGIVHRDFKPGNIFLSDDSSRPISKVADFGLAKTFDTAGLSSMTGDGMYGGTMMFMPRQQIINFRYAKPDVDVWAAAASYYYMLTGFPPKDFSKAKNQAEFVAVVLNTGAIPIQKRNPRIPDRLAKIIDTALIDNPKIVIQSALELKKRIEEAL